MIQAIRMWTACLNSEMSAYYYYLIGTSCYRLLVTWVCARSVREVAQRARTIWRICDHLDILRDLWVSFLIEDVNGLIRSWVYVTRTFFFRRAKWRFTLYWNYFMASWRFVESRPIDSAVNRRKIILRSRLSCNMQMRF